MEDVVTKSQLAAELGCARSRFSQLAKEGMPVRPDGKLNRREVLEWFLKFQSGAAGGWSEQGSRGKADVRTRAETLLAGKTNQPAARQPRQQRAASIPVPAKASLAGSESRQAVIDALRQIVSVKETLNFAMVARSIGCSLEQAQALARWHAVASACAIEVLDVEDLEHLPEATTREWKRTLPGVNFAQADKFYDEASRLGT